MPASRPPERRRNARERLLDVPRIEQPDDVTCGPACLAQIYRFHGDDTPLATIVRSVRTNRDGGTLAVYLAIAARGHGYGARITSWNLRVFDPTWARLAPGPLRARLAARARRVRDAKLRRALHAYAELLALGGRVRFAVDLEPSLLTDPLDRGCPPLVGVSATHLYRHVRERPLTNADDAVGGSPMGHFLVLAGYREGGAAFEVRDPQREDTFRSGGRYRLAWHRLASAILLGDATYDAELLELEPPRRSRP
jgi:hypothetical protein